MKELTEQEILRSYQPKYQLGPKRPRFPQSDIVGLLAVGLLLWRLGLQPLDVLIDTVLIWVALIAAVRF